MAIGYLYVVDAAGAEVDKVEFDVGDYSPEVLAAAAALNVAPDAARKLVAKSNPGAELTSEQRAREYAESIAADHPDGPLRVTSSPPLPTPAAAVSKSTETGKVTR